MASSPSFSSVKEEGRTCANSACERGGGRPTLLDLDDGGGDERVGEAEHVLEQPLGLKFREHYSDFEELGGLRVETRLRGREEGVHDD